MPDIERILTKIYTYSVKTKMRQFYIDAQALTRLDEFYGLVETLREVIKIIKELFHDGDKVKVTSRRLRQLVSLRTLKTGDQDEEMKEGDSDDDDVEGIFPDYSPILDEFEDMIIWKSHGKSKIPEPKRGVFEEFDK